MKDRTISLRQLMTVLFLALFPLGTEQLPGRLSAVGAAAWLCPILAGGIAVALVALLGRSPVLGQGDLGQRIAQRWGQRTGRVLAGIFLLWGLYLTAAHAARIGSRLSDSLRASPILITAVALLLAGWMASGGLPAFARACEVFALVVGFGFFLIFLFGVFRLQWDEVLLWNWQELSQVPQGVFTAGGTVAAGGYVLFLLGDVRPEEKSRGTVMRRLGGLFLLLGAGMLLVLGRLGADLAAQINRPFFQMVSGLGFEGAFQRLEELASALWVLGDAALLGLLLLCLRRLAAQLLGRKESKKQGWGITGIVLLGSIPIAYWNQIIAGNLLPMGNLAALAISVLCMCLVRKQSKNLKKLKKGVDIPGREWYSIKAVARHGAKSRTEKRKKLLDRWLELCYNTTYPAEAVCTL